MKKALLTIIFSILFIPILVNAEECDKSKIYIDSIKVDNNKNVTEIVDAKAKDRTIDLNLEMSKVGDNIRYRIVLKNDSNEEYILNNNSISIDSKYIDYSIETKDNYNIIKANSSKIIYLNIQYKNKVLSSLYNNGNYSNHITLKVDLKTNEGIINPDTGASIYMIITLFFTLIISFTIFKKHKITKTMLLIISLIIPVSINALCISDITINSNVTIKDNNYNPCSTETTINPGDSYVNGQYTYLYKQKRYCGENCLIEDIDEDGWSVYLTDKESTNSVTSKLCSSINNKPIVSMTGMFWDSKVENVDVSVFDTSNVTDMSNMFLWSNLTSFDFTNFDTSKVTDMGGMFEYAKIADLDLSSFNTSKVTDMGGMFSSKFITSLNISSFDTSNVTNMVYMFYGFRLTNIDLSTFNTSNVENMSFMFSGTEFTNLDLSSFNTSKVTNMSNMFDNSNIHSLNLLSFNTSNVENMQSMFRDTPNLQEIDLSSFDTSKLTSGYEMFQNTGATIGYARTQADADMFNSTNNKPNTITFVVKNGS